MYPVIDFRNGRYQGQTKNQLPDGVGILVDKNFMFCVGEWVAGQIKGPALIFFPNGLVFSGQIAFKQPEQLCTYQLPHDHVKLVACPRQRQRNEAQKIAAVLPLLKIILEIDNTSQMEARVLQDYEYSTVNERDNIGCIGRILNFDRKGSDLLMRHSHCLEFLRDCFASRYEHMFEFMINESRGRKEYFFGLRGEGLGIKIQPLEEPGFSFKQTGRVYNIRAVGYFTRQNQLKDIGLKTLDNAMKGQILEEGVYSMPSTVIKYQQGQRPVNCLINFYNHIKRSMYYRDKVIETDYIYNLQRFVLAFNLNLRKAETERLAQYTIENPNNSGQNLRTIEQRRMEKERERESFLKQRENVIESPNPYNPNVIKYSNPDYNLQLAKDQIFRSASKKRTAGNALNQVDYNNVEYVDPKYVKMGRDEKPPKSYLLQAQERPKYDYPRYKYTQRDSRDYREFRDPREEDNFQSRYTPKKNYPPLGNNYFSGNREPQRLFNPDSKYARPSQYATPPKRSTLETHYDPYLQQTKPRPRYDYLFDDESRDNRYEDNRYQQRNASPQRNLRRQTLEQNHFD